MTKKSWTTERKKLNEKKNLEPIYLETNTYKMTELLFRRLHHMLRGREDMVMEVSSSPPLLLGLSVYISFFLTFPLHGMQ
jgi:hypothetical protein